MPNTAEAGTETVVMDAQPATQTDGSAPDTDTAQADKLLFGKWKTMEEAEKGIAEERQLSGHQGNELGQLRQQVEELTRRAELKDVITKLAEAKGQPPPEDDGPMDFDAFAEGLSEKWGTEPKEVIRQLTGVYNQWITRSEGKASREIAELKNMISTMKKELVENIERKDSFYEENKTAIDEAVALGMNLPNAKTFVKKMKARESAPEKVERNLPTGTVTPTHTPAKGTGPSPIEFGEGDLKLLALDYPELDDSGLRKKAAELNAKRRSRQSWDEYNDVRRRVRA